MGSCAFTIPYEVEEEQSQEVEMTPHEKFQLLKKQVEKVNEAIRKFGEIREKSSMDYEKIREMVASRQKKRNIRHKNKKIPGGYPTPSA